MGGISERFPFADGLFHVTNRGVDRRDIVYDDQDRHCWFSLLDRNATRAGWRVFAYALLTNHFHLFLQTPRGNLSTSMRDFEGSYATLFNQRNEREGHLFQGPFHAVVVESHSHSLELTRYLHLNSLRAGLVVDPLCDPWSSYRHYLNPSRAPDWLDWKTVLGEIGGTEAASRLAYKRFLDAGIAVPPENPISAAVDGWILGSESFVEQCRAWRKRIGSDRKPVCVQSIIREVSSTLETSVDQLIARGRHGNRGRELAVLLARELGDESLEVLAEQFGHVTRSAINETARRGRERVEREPTFSKLLDDIRHRLLHGEGSDVQNSELAEQDSSNRERFGRQF